MPESAKRNLVGRKLKKGGLKGKVKSYDKPSGKFLIRYKDRSTEMVKRHLRLRRLI